MAEAKNKKKPAKSGNPAVRATAAAAPSSAAAFKKNRGGLLTLPSGLVVKATRAEGLRGFIAGGKIPNSLMGIVDDALKGGKAPDASVILDGEGEIDENMVADMLEMTDKVVMSVVKDPIIHPLPASEGERDDDLVYIDEVDDEDKMFIFQWVTGGTDSVERFRQESAGALDVVARSSVVGNSPQ